MLISLVLVLAGCEAAAVGELSPWHLDPSFAIKPETTTLHLFVDTSHCGDHGAKVNASVDYGPTVVAIRTRVLLPNCLTGPGPTPFTLELREPVGNRRLLDGYLPRP